MTRGSAIEEQEPGIPRGLTHGSRTAQGARATSEGSAAQSRPEWPVTVLQLQRSVGNRAAAALLRTGATAASRTQAQIQRNGESAKLLAELATPQVKPGPAVDVQKNLVKKLDVEHANDFPGPLLNLGGILIDEIPKSDSDLIKQAELIGFPVHGSFQSAGGRSKGARIKELKFDRLVVENTLKTMIDAREIEYLRSAGLPNDDWKILIEVHYFRERDMSATGFHKDTLGETLFVNLNYAMDKKVIGPEYVVNPPPMPKHDEQLAASLPKGFRDDLAYTREKLGEPKEIGAKMVDPYGYVAFVDEAVHHATPHHWHRHVTGGDLSKYLQTKYPAAFREAMAEYPKYANRGRMYYWSYFSSWVDPSIISAVDSSKWAAWMDVVTPILAADTLRQDLESKYPAEFKEASAAYKKYVNRGRMYYWSYFSAWVDPSIISAADSGKWLGWMEIIAAGDAKRNLNLTRISLKASMTDDQFDEMLETVGAEGAPRTKGGAGGFYSASIPGAGEHPVRPKGRPALKRRLSQPDFRKQLGPAPGEHEKRRFFRTWVRVIPKAKADALRKAL